MPQPDPSTPGGLSADDLGAESATALPAREALSTIHLDLPTGVDNLAMPINQATAVNENSSQCYAIADADQIIQLDQSSTSP
jgi:hypothetical protein